MSGVYMLNDCDELDLLNIQDLMNETGCTWETAYQAYFEAEGDMVLALAWIEARIY